MRIIGVDLHARQQTVAALDTDSGEVMETTLQHSPQDQEEVRSFYAALPRPALVGLEASGSMQWFLGLLDELGWNIRWAIPPKFARRSRANRNTIAATRLCCYVCYAKIASQRSGCLRRSNAISAVCCCIATSWCACAWAWRTCCKRSRSTTACDLVRPCGACEANSSWRSCRWRPTRRGGQLQALRQKLETQISKLD